MARRTHQIDGDWYPGNIPGNVEVADTAYLDSAYGFGAFLSEQQPGLRLAHASGMYDRTTVVVGPAGSIDVGEYSCLNGTFVICNERVSIGAHCLLSWGVVITDTPGGEGIPVERRRAVLMAAQRHPLRWLEPLVRPRQVSIEDNVWVGFDSVILPGVTLAQGSIVGCKSVVAEDVPPYTVVVGNPARVVRTLTADDTQEARARALFAHQHG